MIEPSCRIYGTILDVSRLEKLIDCPISNKDVKGSIGTVGKYKGVRIPYGACSIETPNNVKPESRVIWLADQISKNKELIRSCGGEDITFSIYWSGEQGNMEFTSEELSKIAKLDIPLTIDYVFETCEKNT